MYLVNMQHSLRICLMEEVKGYRLGGVLDLIRSHTLLSLALLFFSQNKLNRAAIRS